MIKGLLFSNSHREDFGRVPKGHSPRKKSIIADLAKSPFVDTAIVKYMLEEEIRRKNVYFTFVLTD